MWAVTASDQAPDQVARVRRYYDRNTARFQRLGEGGASIHRAVWAPGVTTRDAAFHHVEEQALALLADVPAPRVVDLGCGVGGSLLHLAWRRPELVGEGVTISPAQAEVAVKLIADAGLGGRVRVREGDFLAPPDDLAGADLALSIEAFVHGPDPAAYFAAAAVRAAARRPARGLRRHPHAAGAAAAPGQARRLEEYRTGWRVASLITAQEATRHAAERRPGERAGRRPDAVPRPAPPARSLASAADRRHPAAAASAASTGGRWRVAMRSGTACATGLIAYRLLVFRRDARQEPTAGAASQASQIAET